MEKDIYINDLLDDNKKLFALNGKCRDRKKEYIKQLSDYLNGYDINNLKIISELVGKVLGLNYIIHMNNKDITYNLRTIEGLRDGTIKEI